MLTGQDERCELNFVYYGWLLGLRNGRGLIWSWDAGRVLHGTTAALLGENGEARGWTGGAYRSWLSELATKLRRTTSGAAAAEHARKVGPLQLTEVAVLQRATVANARDLATRRSQLDAEVKAAAAQAFAGR